MNDQAPKTPVLPKLVISLQPDANLAIAGPIDNKTLCYGMLEAAKDAVREYVAKQQQGQIIRPARPPLNGL